MTSHSDTINFHFLIFNLIIWRSDEEQKRYYFRDVPEKYGSYFPGFRRAVLPALYI